MKTEEQYQHSSNSDETDIEEMGVEELLEKADIIAVAQKGISINSKLKKLEKEFSEIKNKLRDYGKSLSGDSMEMVQIDTPDGNIQVSFRDDRVYISKRDQEDIVTLQEDGVLTDEAFDAIFEEITMYDLRDDHEGVLEDLSELQRDRLEEVLSKTSYSPSVRFPNV